MATLRERLAMWILSRLTTRCLNIDEPLKTVEALDSEPLVLEVVALKGGSCDDNHVIASSPKELN